jgi:queuine tRNA-ribosyltransferase
MQYPGFKFEVVATKDAAKAGVMTTRHGVVETPVFMPVGTRGTVKSLSPDDVADTGAEILLGNTYHLYLRPGEKLIQSFGGLHEFMRWDKPILTDSGGYQVSSLGLFKPGEAGNHLSKIDDDGVTFRSHLDGSTHRFTPEKAVQIQHDLNSDILMAFDEATPDKGRDYARQAMERTHKWLVRCKAEWQRLESNNALFGIIQGGSFEDLRRESAQFVIEQDLPGIALGGGSVGQDPAETELNAAWVRDMWPTNKPVYFMGVGVKPSDLVAAVKSGADMFDCVAPTKLARTGLLYTGTLTGLDQPDLAAVRFESAYDNERIAIEKLEFAADDRPIDDGCGCYTCAHGFSRAYLRHLFRSRELLYYRLASIHNVFMMVNTVKLLRSYILGSW